MEGLNEGGKILGMPRKVAAPVLGVAVIAVVYVVIRSRSQGGATQASAPEQSGGTIGGGGGGGGYVGGYADAAPVNPLQEKLDRLYFEKEQFGYNVQQRQEDERQANWEIQHQEQQSSLDTFRELLPFQLETQKSYEGAQQAGYAAEAGRQGYLQEAYQTAAAGEEVVQRSIAGKKKVECPVGMHFVVNAEGGGQCQPLGGGGFNFSTITKGIAGIVGGIFQGAAAAAPGIGAGAAQYGAAQIGIIPGQTSQRPRFGTPGISPEPSHATPYAGSTDLSYPGLA